MANKFLTTPNIVHVQSAAFKTAAAQVVSVTLPTTATLLNGYVILATWGDGDGTSGTPVSPTTVTGAGSSGTAWSSEVVSPTVQNWDAMRLDAGLPQHPHSLGSNGRDFRSSAALNPAQDCYMYTMLRRYTNLTDNTLGFTFSTFHTAKGYSVFIVPIEGQVAANLTQLGSNTTTSGYGHKTSVTSGAPMTLQMANGLNDSSGNPWPGNSAVGEEQTRLQIMTCMAVGGTGDTPWTVRREGHSGWAENVQDALALSGTYGTSGQGGNSNRRAEVAVYTNTKTGSPVTFGNFNTWITGTDDQCVMGMAFRLVQPSGVDVDIGVQGTDLESPAVSVYTGMEITTAVQDTVLTSHAVIPGVPVGVTAAAQDTAIQSHPAALTYSKTFVPTDYAAPIGRHLYNQLTIRGEPEAQPEQIAVPTADIQVLAYAPTAAVQGTIVVEVPTTDINIAAYAPVADVSATTFITPPVLDIQVEGYAPDLVTYTQLQPPHASVYVWTLAPEVSVIHRVAVDTADVSVLPYPPTATILDPALQGRMFTIF